jgi:lipid-binding SYLF domain-containing protein
VLEEIHGIPDKDIPDELWDRAKCVIVVPSVKKAAFVRRRVWKRPHELQA